MCTLDPRLRDFIQFCANRRGAEWPQIYDEMVIVAGQRLYQGLGYNELNQLGLSLRLNNIDTTILQVKQALTTDCNF